VIIVILRERSSWNNIPNVLRGGEEYMSIFQKISSAVNRFKWRRMWLIYILYSILSIFFIAYIFVMQWLTKADYLTTLITFIALVILIPISLLGLFALRSQIRIMEVILQGSGIKTDQRSEEEYSKIQSINVLAGEIRSKTTRIQELEKEVERLSLQILKPEIEDSMQQAPQEPAPAAQKEPKKEEGIVEERRRSSRADQVIEVAFKDMESFIKAYIGNVGGGGLFIKTDEPIALNETLVVRFYLPNDNEPITVEGKVVWVTPKGVKNPSYPPGLGLKFVHLNPKDKKKLDDFISKVPS
jgi:type IV pilus assembly protein PilZ